jgi:hypothetical protein
VFIAWNLVMNEHYSVSDSGMLVSDDTFSMLQLAIMCVATEILCGATIGHERRYRQLFITEKLLLNEHLLNVTA